VFFYVITKSRMLQWLFVASCQYEMTDDAVYNAATDR